MFKKFLALMAIAGVVLSATSTAFADLPGGSGDAGMITAQKVSATSFKPSNKETITVSFDLKSDVDVRAYVLDSKNAEVATFKNWEPEKAGNVVYTWYGRIGNIEAGSPLAAGVYTIRIYARDLDKNILDQEDLTVEIKTDVSPKITGLEAKPSSFSTEKSATTEIYFTTTKIAYVKVYIQDSTLTTVRNFSQYDGESADVSVGTQSVTWDGKNDQGEVLPFGKYTVLAEISNIDGKNTYTTEVTLTTFAPVSSGIIEDFKLVPSEKEDEVWDPTDEELEISFELTNSTSALTIKASNGKGSPIEIVDDEFVDDGDYTEYWDGTDDDGDYVDEGVWTITIKAGANSEISETVKVEYEEPSITESFVTKDSFDPSENEFTNLVFKVNSTSVVTVDVYKGPKKEFTLLKDEEVRKNRWYSVIWDGMDEEGDEVDFGTDWKFVITAENSTEDDVLDSETVEVDVEEDDVSDSKSNVTNDFTEPVVLDEDSSDVMYFSYCNDEDAEVYLAVYEGKATSTGKAETVLLDYVSQDAGCSTIEWNGNTDKGKQVKNGVYTYKLVSKIGSHKDTEIGRFVVGNAGTIDEVDPEPIPDPVYPEPVDDVVLPISEDCSFYYNDLNYITEEDELCTAIAWATEEGIFSGYWDGTFKPYQTINRAEVTKVVLEAFGQKLLPINGSNEGFSDVDAYAWYMPYVRTAKYYGMLSGYPDGTLKLENSVNRVELLKLVLEASNAFTSYEWATGYYYPTDMYYYYDVNPYDPSESWFYEYANAAYQYNLYNPYIVDGKEYLMPAQNVERGEVALLLYRMAKAGLIY